MPGAAVPGAQCLTQCPQTAPFPPASRLSPPACQRRRRSALPESEMATASAGWHSSCRQCLSIARAGLSSRVLLDFCPAPRQGRHSSRGSALLYGPRGGSPRAGRRASFWPGAAGDALAGDSVAREAMELALGFEFEDSVFAQSRDRGRGGGGCAAYTAKRCEPQWFCEGANSEDDVEILTAKKFRGDLAYRQQEFQKALYEYSSCLLLLPSSNVAMRRDVQEGQARCLAHLGRHQEALDIAEKLRNGATNTDHLTTVLNLQFAIYCRLKNTEKKITCLQQLISLHPFNPWNWKLLAEAYMSFLQTLPPSFISEMKHLQCKDCTANDHVFQTSPGLFGKEMNLQCHKTLSGRQDVWSTLSTKTTRDKSVSYSDSHMVEGSLHITEECETRDKMKHATFEFWGQEALKDVWIKACASFVRTRLLLQITQLQQSSFALDQNLKIQKEAEDKVKGFGLKEEPLLLITEVMGEDLIPEKLKEDGQGEIKCVSPSALTSLVTTSAIEFEGKWFKKLQDSLSL